MVCFLQNLFLQWQGIAAASDEGIVHGDAVLVLVVWRNLYEASPQGVDFGRVVGVECILLG